MNEKNFFSTGWYKQFLLLKVALHYKKNDLTKTNNARRDTIYSQNKTITPAPPSRPYGAQWTVAHILAATHLIFGIRCSVKTPIHNRDISSPKTFSNQIISE